MDTGVSGFFTTIGITLATSSAPIVAITGERAADVNAWFYLKSGTSSVPGWYQITAVDTVGHTYTLNAAIGAAVLANGTPSTAVGCGSAATLTNQTCSVDFTQQAAYTATGTGTTATTTLTATTAIFTKQMVGNGVTNGTSWKVITAFTSTTVVTVDSAPTWTAQTIYVGGGLATLDKSSALFVAGNSIFTKTGTYSTSAGINFQPTPGTRSTPVVIVGYASVRGDGGTAPTINAGANSITILHIGNAHIVQNINVNANSKTSITGFNLDNSQGQAVGCSATGCTTGFVANQPTSYYKRCFASTCGTGFSFGSATGCVASASTTAGFTTLTFIVDCLAINGTGSGVGFKGAGHFVNCTAYGNASDGFWVFAEPMSARNCISYGNSGYGFNEVYSGLILENCAYGNNTLGNLQATASPLSTGNVTLTADPFTNAAGGDFSLNATAGGGASCRAAGIPGAFPGLTGTTGYLDIGAVQHLEGTRAYASVS